MSGVLKGNPNSTLLYQSQAGARGLYSYLRELCTPGGKVGLLRHFLHLHASNGTPLNLKLPMAVACAAAHQVSLTRYSTH